MGTSNIGQQWQQAIEADDVDTVRELLKHPYGDIFTQCLKKYRTDGTWFLLDPLYEVARASENLSPISAHNGDKLAIVKLLVEAGYDMKRIGRAVKEATVDVLPYLLDKCGDAEEPEMSLLAYSGRAAELQFWFDRGKLVTPGMLHNATCGRGRHRGYETDDHTGWPDAFRDTVRVLIAAGADVNERNPGGNTPYDGCKPFVTNRETPLHFAAASWDINVIQQLLDVGADKTLANELGEAPYDYAVKWQASEEVMALLRVGDETERSDDALAKLIQAVKAADANVAVKLVESNKHLVNAPIAFGDSGKTQTLLHLIMPGDGRAQRPAHVQIAQSLLENGAVVDALGERPNLGTCTPLTIAAWGGHAELSRLLLKHGADVNGGADEMPDHPVYAAAWHGHTEAVETLIKAGARYELCHLVMAGLTDRVADQLDMSNQSAEMLKLLLDHGLDLTHQSCRYTLHKAAAGGCVKLIEMLLEHGADPNAKNEQGCTTSEVAKSNWQTRGREHPGKV